MNKTTVLLEVLASIEAGARTLFGLLCLVPHAHFARGFSVKTKGDKNE
jgi:hypothetical protein